MNINSSTNIYKSRESDGDGELLRLDLDFDTESNYEPKVTLGVTDGADRVTITVNLEELKEIVDKFSLLCRK